MDNGEDGYLKLNAIRIVGEGNFIKQGNAGRLVIWRLRLITVLGILMLGLLVILMNVKMEMGMDMGMGKGMSTILSGNPCDDSLVSLRGARMEASLGL